MPWSTKLPQENCVRLVNLRKKIFFSDFRLHFWSVVFRLYRRFALAGEQRSKNYEYLTFGIYYFPRQNIGGGFVLSNTLGVGYNRREHANLKTFLNSAQAAFPAGSTAATSNKKGISKYERRKKYLSFSSHHPAADPRPSLPEYLKKRSVNAVADATGTKPNPTIGDIQIWSEKWNGATDVVFILSLVLCVGRSGHLTDELILRIFFPFFLFARNRLFAGLPRCKGTRLGSHFNPYLLTPRQQQWSWTCVKSTTDLTVCVVTHNLSPAE